METIGNADVAEAIAQVRERVPALAQESMTEYARNTPRFAESGIPPHLFRESMHTSRTVMRVTLDSVVSEEPAIEAALNEVAARGIDRAAERLPLREYLRAWNTGFDILTAAVTTAFDDARLVLETLGRMRRTHDLLLRRAADAYATAVGDVAAASSRQDSEVLDALLSGGARLAEEPAIPPGAVVVHLWAAEVPGEGSEDPETSAVTRHRKIGQVRTHLFRELANLLLLDISGRWGRMLLSSALPEPDTLAEGLASTIGASVTMASEPAEDRADLPRASRTARAALDTAVCLGVTGRHIRMQDVALEHQLSHRTVALPYLDERCRPILEDETLRLTMVSFMENDLDRRATAEELYVHPNTVDNRLARIRSLTGLDVRRTRDLMTIGVTVTAQRLPPV